MSVLDSWPEAVDTGQRVNWNACCSSSPSLHDRLVALMISKGTCWSLVVAHSFYIRPGYADYKSGIVVLPTCGHSIVQPWPTSNAGPIGCLPVSVRTTHEVESREPTMLTHRLPV